MSKYDNVWKDMCQNFNSRYPWLMGVLHIYLFLYAYLHFIILNMLLQRTNWGQEM